MTKKAKYILHIEGEECEPSYFATKKEIRKEISRLAKEYGRTISEIDQMAYIMTVAEYETERAELAEIEAERNR